MQAFEGWMLIVIIWQVHVAGIDSFSQTCKIGYEFWESEKQVCRQCSDFEDYCWQDVLHIANCSTFCKERLQKPVPCHDDRDLYMYIPTGVCILVICAFLIPTIVKKIRKYRKLKKGLHMESTSSLDKHSEPDTCLLQPEGIQTDQNENLQEVRTNVPNGFVPLNQIPVTESSGHAVVTTGAKYLEPRSGEATKIHNIIV